MTDSDQELQQQPLPVEQPEADDEDSKAMDYGVAIALGFPLGIVFGLLVLDNVALGAAISVVLVPVIYMIMSGIKKA